MGSERAAIMMDLLPPVGWGEVATRADLTALEHRLEHGLDARISRMETSLMRSFVTWLLASQATVITGVGLLIAFT